MIQVVAAVRKKQMDSKKAQKLYNVPKISLRPYVNMKDNIY
jgi:translation initiation factor IF-3